MNQSKQSNQSKTERAGVQALRFLGRKNEKGQVRGYVRDTSSAKSLRGFDGTEGGQLRPVVWAWLRSNAYLRPVAGDRSKWVISDRGLRYLASLVQPEVVAPPKATTYKDTPKSRWEAQQVAVARAAAEIIQQRRALREQLQSVSYSL